MITLNLQSSWLDFISNNHDYQEYGLEAMRPILSFHNGSGIPTFFVCFVHLFDLVCGS